MQFTSDSFTKLGFITINYNYNQDSVICDANRLQTSNKRLQTFKQSDYIYCIYFHLFLLGTILKWVMLLAITVQITDKGLKPKPWTTGSLLITMFQPLVNSAFSIFGHSAISELPLHRKWFLWSTPAWIMPTHCCLAHHKPNLNKLHRIQNTLAKLVSK